jgi:hypothetical protein
MQFFYPAAYYACSELITILAGWLQASNTTLLFFLQKKMQYTHHKKKTEKEKEKRNMVAIVFETEIVSPDWI